MNDMATVMAEGERVYQRGIIHDTFGHLAPEPDRVYTGYILFTHGCYGDLTVIDWKFADAQGELESSPWIYEDIQRVVGDMVLPPWETACQLPEGRVYRFNGTYTRTPDRPKWPGSEILIEGKGRFRGKVRRVRIRTGEENEA